MGFWTYVNGVPTYNGAMNVVGNQTITGTQTVTGNIAGGAGLTLSAGDVVLPASRFISWSGRSAISSTVDGSVEFINNSGSTYANVLVQDVDFRQPGSTFGSIATMTNGPRAANPVAWVEVKVAGSTGRVPVW